MIELELQTTKRAHTGVSWVSVARLKVEGEQYEIHDPASIIDLSLRLPTLRHEHLISFNEDREEWTRGLTLIFNAPDLVPVVLADTHPWPVAEHRGEIVVPQLPDDPEGVAQPIRESTRHAVTT